MLSKHSIIEPGVRIGEDSDVWHFTHVRTGAVIGKGTTVGSHCYIDTDVTIGDNCKIQSGCLIYHPAVIGNGVFVGPGVGIINDKNPRAVDEYGNKLTADDWECEGVIIKDRASIGTGSVIMPGTTIGEGAMVGAGSIVTKDVPDNAVVYGDAACQK